MPVFHEPILLVAIAAEASRAKQNLANATPFYPLCGSYATINIAPLLLLDDSIKLLYLLVL
jgi:hypothetical protein